MFALVRMLSSHLILTFAFAHTRPSTDQVLFLCGYRYISDPGTNFLCFIKTWCTVLLIYHFYNRLFPEGCRSWWWHCYDLWWNCWRKMYALFGSPSSDTWCLFPQLELLPFQVLFTIFWNTWVYLEGGVCKVVAAFLQLAVISTQSWFFFFFLPLFSWGPEVHIRFSLVSPHLPRHISSQERKRKHRLEWVHHRGSWMPVIHTVGGHLPFPPGQVIYY